MKVTVVVDDEHKLTIGSWWASSPEFALKEFRSQLAIAQCIWPELQGYELAKDERKTESGE